MVERDRSRSSRPTLNERDVAIVQARAAGFVERVPARVPGDVVAAVRAARRDPGARSGSAAQQESRRHNRQTRRCTRGAPAPPLLLGIPDAQVEAIDALGAAAAVADSHRADPAA